IIAHPCRSMQMGSIVVLVPDVVGTGRFQSRSHETKRMRDQALVVITIGKRDAGNAQAVLVPLVGQRHAVALLRQCFADDLETDLMVVVLHRVEQSLSPQSPLAGLSRSPDNGER